MRTSPEAKSFDAWKAAVYSTLAAGFAIRLWIASWPLERLIRTFVADDAFYYIKIAGNILTGQGSTFDGLTATNGYHPLWMLIVTLFQALAGPDPERVLRVMMFAEAVLALATGVLIVRIVAKETAPASKLAPALAAVFWAFNPFFAGTEMMGVEAPLAAVCVLAAYLIFLRWMEIRTTKALALVGAFCGLAFLARTDAGLFGAILGMFVIAAKDESGKRPLGDLAKRTAAFAAPAASVASPWLAWNLFRFESIWQDSGRVLYFREHSQFVVSGGNLIDRLHDALSSGYVNYLLRLLGGSNIALMLLILGVGIGMIVAMTAMGKGASGRAPIPIVLFALAIWTFYILVFWQQKFWYFLPVMTAIALLLARFGAFFEEMVDCREKARPLALFAVAGLVAAILFARIPSVVATGFHSWQELYLQAARDIAGGRIDGLAADETIGAFNAGIIGSFSGRRVINLDGVVNPHIIDAMRKMSFLSYLRESGVGVIVDHQEIIETYSIWAEPEYGHALKILRRYPCSSFAGDILVARVMPQEVKP